MKNVIGIKDKCEAQLVSSPGLHNGIRVGVKWEWEHWRDGKLIDVWEYFNTCSDEGLDAMLDIMFHAATQITTWYVLIFEDDVTPDGDTNYATPVFNESTAYDEATRPEYEEAAAASQVTTNTANKATFTIDATKTIYGAALVGGGTDANTKDDAAGGGTLFSASKFGAAKACVDNDVLNVTISITLADT